MTSTLHAAGPFSRNRAGATARILAAGSALALVASAALAGPVSPSHEFERVGRNVSDVAAMLPMPGLGRALILEHDGDLRLTTGDALLNDLLYHVDVSQTFAGDGLLGGEVVGPWRAYLPSDRWRTM